MLRPNLGVLQKFKKLASPKLTTVPVSPKESTKKLKRVKRPAKKSTNAPTACVFIRDTPGVSVSKKKAPAKADRGKGIELLSDATLLEDAQLEKAIMKSRQETHKLQASGSSEGVNFESEVHDESKAKSSDISEGTGVKPGVPYVFKADSSKSDNESWGHSDDDNESDDNDDEGCENDDDSRNDAQDSERLSRLKRRGIPKILKSDVHEEEETSRRRIQYDDLYKDVKLEDQKLQEKKHEEVRKGDIVMPDTYSKDYGSKQSSSVSSRLRAKILTSIRSQIPIMVDHRLSTRIGFATQMALQSYTTEFEKKAQEEKDRYINLVEKSIKDIIKDEVKSQLPQILPKEVSDFSTPVIQSAINESLDNVILAKSSSQPKSTYQAAASLTEFELKKILLDKIQKSKSYQAAPEYKEPYDALVKYYKLDKDLFDCYGNIYSLKRDHDDKYKDEDPSVGSDRGLKKRKTSKNVEPTKGPNTKELKSSSSKGTKSQSKSSRKSVQAEEPEFEVADSDMP
ncbi:hypothetical protein Tco_0058049 [Tanacetum coccineum]